MTNKIPIYSSSSPYYSTPINAAGQMGSMVFRPVPSTSSDRVITLSQNYNLRPDLLAHDLYGDSQLWWVFAQRNPNVLSADPLGNFKAGITIFIPDY